MRRGKDAHRQGSSTMRCRRTCLRSHSRGVNSSCCCSLTERRWPSHPPTPPAHPPSAATLTQPPGPPTRLAHPPWPTYLVDRVQEVLLRHSLAACADGIHARLCGHAADVGARGVGAQPRQQLKPEARRGWGQGRAGQAEDEREGVGRVQAAAEGAARQQGCCCCCQGGTRQGHKGSRPHPPTHLMSRSMFIARVWILKICGSQTQAEQGSQTATGRGN